MSESRLEKVKDLNQRLSDIHYEIERAKGMLAHVKKENARLEREKAYFRQLADERGKKIKQLQYQLDRKIKPKF